MIRAEERNKGIVETIVKYDDGTEEVVKSGIIIILEPENDEVNVSPFNVTGEDFTSIMLSITEAHMRMLLFMEAMNNEDED